MESLRSFLPEEQNYVSPWVTLNTKEFQDFLVVYGVSIILLSIMAVSYSMYCSYPTIRRDVHHVVCGPTIAKTPSAFRHAQRFPHSLVRQLPSLPTAHYPIEDSKPN